MCRSICIQLYQDKVDLFEILTIVDNQWTTAFREVALKFHGVVGSLFSVADVKRVSASERIPHAYSICESMKEATFGKNEV
jgi:hypothetical protein